MKFTLYHAEAQDVFGLCKYTSTYRGNIAGKDAWTEADRVYRWKKEGAMHDDFMASVRQFAASAGCSQIVAVPGHTPKPSRLQTVFGEAIKRTEEGQPRKYHHTREVDEPPERFDLTDAPTGGKVLLVDDICTSGGSLEYFAALLSARGCDVVKFALGVNRKLDPHPIGEIDPRTPQAPTIGPVSASQAPPPAPLSNADRQARFVARRNTITELPPVRDPDRRRRAEADLIEWGVTYCTASPDSFGLLARSPSERMRGYPRDLQAALASGGLIHVVLPRGSGKTTWAKIALLYALATGRSRYAVAFAASSSLAAAILADVWNVIRFSVPFCEDYPEISHPVNFCEGMPQRFQSNRYKPPASLENPDPEPVPTRIQKTSNLLRLPVIPGAPSSGATLRALGAGAAARGLVQGSERPSLILCDDLQTRKTATSPDSTDKLEAWIAGDVEGLAGSSLIPIIQTSTPIVHGDLSERFSDPERHPEWRNIKYRFVLSPPTASALWDEYDSRFLAALRHEDFTFADATDFYRKHRDEMDAGAEVYDPDNYDPRLELSGYQHARDLRLRMGDAAFRAEYQLETIAEASLVSISPRLVASRLTASPRLSMPPGTSRALAFLDVNIVAGISYTVTAFGRGGVAAVIDYGRFHGRGKRLVPENATERETRQIVAAALDRVLSALYALRLPTADGKTERVSAVGVDCGYLSDVVHRVCSLYRRKGYANTHGVKGYANAYYSQTGKNVLARGRGIDFRTMDGNQFYAQDSDVWKEMTQRAFLGEPLQNGSLSLFGTDPEVHADYARELCAETLADKATSARGVDFYKWTLKGENHYLDSTSGTFALAGWFRLLDLDATPRKPTSPGEPATVADAPPPRKPRPVRRRIVRRFWDA